MAKVSWGLDQGPGGQTVTWTWAKHRWLWLAVIYGDQIKVGRRAAKPRNQRAKPSQRAPQAASPLRLCRAHRARPRCLLQQSAARSADGATGGDSRRPGCAPSSLAGRMDASTGMGAGMCHEYRVPEQRTSTTSTSTAPHAFMHRTHAWLLCTAGRPHAHVGVSGIRNRDLHTQSGGDWGGIWDWDRCECGCLWRGHALGACFAVRPEAPKRRTCMPPL